MALNAYTFKKIQSKYFYKSSKLIYISMFVILIILSFVCFLLCVLSRDNFNFPVRLLILILFVISIPFSIYCFMKARTFAGIMCIVSSIIRFGVAFGFNNTIAPLFLVVPIIMVILGFTIKMTRRYPSSLPCSAEYLKKYYEAEANNKLKEFNDAIENALLLNNIEEFAKLLDIKCECSNEEYSKIYGVSNASSIETNGESSFQASSFIFWLHTLLWNFLTIISFGIAYPFVVSMKETYLSKRTITSGHKNDFDGNGFQLIGKYIIWLILCVITFGIYSIVLIARLLKWKASHTHFVDSNNKLSTYDGSGFVRFFMNLGLTFLAVITLSFAYPFKVATMLRYDKRHTIIDGYRLQFTGTAMGYFGKHIIWTLLTIITLGIYYIFVPLKKQKWIREHTIINSNYDNDLQTNHEIKKLEEIKENDEPEKIKEVVIENQETKQEPEIIESNENSDDDDDTANNNSNNSGSSNLASLLNRK